MADSKDKQPQEWLQEMMGQMTSQMGGMAGTADPIGAMKSLQRVAESWAQNPQELAEAVKTWSEQITATNQQVWQEFLNQKAAAPTDPEGKADWSKLPYFKWIREYYQTYAGWMEQNIQNAPVEEDVKRDATFWTRQMLSALSPDNYFWTNPNAINQFVETKGESLRSGLQNWLKDVSSGDGLPETVDKSPFQVGENLANTPGKVVFRNDLMELIQYSPMTDEVYERPVVITPPWINKYYILDLAPKKSFIRNLVSKGFTTFVISWKNPTEEMRNVGMDDYLMQGPVMAMDVAQQITGAKKVHAVGYCIGGTLLSSVLAWYNHPKNKKANPVEDWTLLTTLVDYEQPGDLGVFINEESLKMLEESMAEQGFLDGKQMGTTMRMLRPDGLIWHYFINNYLYGKQPPPIDMLFWNDDSTRMPEAMHKFYLREYYLHNRLREKDALTLAGHPIDLRRIKEPLYCVSAEEDHITPWKQVYQINKLVQGPVRFNLSTSGHIAGVVNPPVDPPKRSYWAGAGDSKQDPEAWQAKQKKVDDSWWNDWTAWLSERSGSQVAPPKLGSTKHKPLADAPGTYVLEP